MRDTILIVLDELTCWNNLPKDITNSLPGYQLFKKKSIEFTNIQTSRQQCSPSRSTIMTGLYDTGIQDNMEFSYQYNYIQELPTNLETAGKIYKSNGYDLTAYRGKQHLVTKFAPNIYTTPQFNTATVPAMKIYGYDTFNVTGDNYYNPTQGLLSDNQTISYILPPNSIDYDYIEKNIKYSGVIPFIKARLEDSKSFYIECHIINPHDTNHFIQNLSGKTRGQMNQFPLPFFFEQIKESKISNPYYFNDAYNYAVPTHPNLLNNYFEPDFNSYKTNLFSLPFLTSFELDYAISPQINSYNPILIGTYYGIKLNMSMSESQADIKDWKNFINNYWGLLLEADSYLEKLYWFFEETGLFEKLNIIITSDHGDQISAHGLKQKQLPFKESSNVACLIYSPDLSPELVGKTSDLYGSLVDILPTQIVLNNLVNSSDSKFDGKSLLVWDTCGCKRVLKINYKEHKNYIPVNIVNSTMYALNYFFYLQWYKQNYNSQPLTSNPTNYFDFQSSFCSIITELNGLTYKFGRYYSIYSTIVYQLFINPEQDKFSKQGLVKYISGLNKLLVQSSIGFFIKTFPSVFTFQEGLDIIKDNFDSGNIYLNYVYYGFISNTLSGLNNFVYLVPGSKSSWETNEQLGIFSYFLYDIQNDTSESFNLLDPKNINFVNADLKQQLNDILNNSLQEKNCSSLKTIIAESTIVQLALLIYILGGFLNTIIPDVVTNILGTLAGESALDTSFSEEFKKEIQVYINGSINKINFTDFANPYNLFDPVEQIYWVGDFEYIKEIYKLFGYFSKTIISAGLPNISNQNYIIKSNNILPNLIVFKILDK